MKRTPILYFRCLRQLTNVLFGLTLCLAEFAALKVVGIAEAAAEYELAAHLLILVVVPTQVIAHARALNLRKVARVCWMRRRK